MISHALTAKPVHKLLLDFSRIKTREMKGKEAGEAEPHSLTVP